jgi:formate dehydrogenase major subunit
MEAKARGAKVIHIDPRFTRTSAVADQHVPIRVGSDIAFLGGIIRYILDNEQDFREYVVAYTNAATILREDFVDTEDLDGLFSGYDPETGSYDGESWQYAGHDQEAGVEEHGGGEQRERAGGDSYGSGGAPVEHKGVATRRSSTRLRLPDPAPPLRPLHPGVRRARLRHPAGDLPRAGRRDHGQQRPRAHHQLELRGRLDQHTTGVQYIRAASILQTLLGNIGRPGGGIMALRGHASIQGSTDIPTLFNLLPGYLPMPEGDRGESLEAYLAPDTARPGSGATSPTTR